MLEEKFTVLLPDELLFEQDATLQTLADVLIAGQLITHHTYIHFHVIHVCVRRNYEVSGGDGLGNRCVSGCE